MSFAIAPGAKFLIHALLLNLLSLTGRHGRIRKERGVLIFRIKDHMNRSIFSLNLSEHVRNTPVTQR